jgi:hypothetical protein
VRRLTCPGVQLLQAVLDLLWLNLDRAVLDFVPDFRASLAMAVTSGPWVLA